jgi:TolB protein
VFVANRDEQQAFYQNLHILNVSDLQVQRLTQISDSFISRPAWSPDGALIAFESKITSSRQAPDIYLVNSAGGSPRALTSSAGSPAWHPSGQKFVFFKFDSNGSLATINKDGSNEQTLITGYAQPDYSPDGQKIVSVGIVAGQPNNSEIFVLDADGTDPVNITNNPAADTNPDWR